MSTWITLTFFNRRILLFCFRFRNISNVFTILCINPVLATFSRTSSLYKFFYPIDQ